MQGQGTLHTSPPTKDVPPQSMQKITLERDKQTDGQTLQLLDRIGPAGRFGENLAMPYIFHLSW